MEGSNRQFKRNGGQQRGKIQPYFPFSFYRFLFFSFLFPEINICRVLVLLSLINFNANNVLRTYEQYVRRTKSAGKFPS